MVKRSRAERVAKAGARTAGTGIGAFFSNPIVAGITLLLGALLIFRGDITGAISGFKLPEIKLPFAEGFGDIKFPEFKFPDISFPDISFPEFPEIKLPDFQGLFTGFQEQLDKFEFPTIPPFFREDPEDTSIPDPLDQNLSVGLAGGIQQRQRDLREALAEKGVTPAQQFTAERAGASSLFGIIDFLGLQFAPQAAAAEKPTDEGQTPSSVISLLPSPQEFGIGGINVSGLPIFGTIKETPITTLTQVLNLFPDLTASQAADFLGEFSGISPAAALLQGGDVINITGSPDDPPQVINQTSLGIAGTAQQIFNLLFPNVKSNF